LGFWGWWSGLPAYWGHACLELEDGLKGFRIFLALLLLFGFQFLLIPFLDLLFQSLHILLKLLVILSKLHILSPKLLHSGFQFLIDLSFVVGLEQLSIQSPLLFLMLLFEGLDSFFLLFKNETAPFFGHSLLLVF
jgi:hypothetical protein